MRRIVITASLIAAALGFGQLRPARAACTVAGLVPGDICVNAGFANGNFQNRDLHGVILTNANLRGATMSGANLTSARLDQAQMRGANLTQVNLASANLQNAVLGDSILTGATLTDASLIAADLGAAAGAGAILIRANLSQASLYGANFAGAKFPGASLVQASTYGGQADFTGADFKGANLTQANLKNAILRNVDLTGANLTAIYWPNADLSGATWVDGTKCAANSIGRCIVTTVTGAPDMAAGPIRPQPGLWRTAESGTGYLFELTGTGLRLVVIGFDGLGMVTWSIAEGRIGRDNVFTSDLKRCASAGNGPADCSADLGPIAVSFDSATSASLLAPGAAAVRIAPAAQN